MKIIITNNCRIQAYNSIIWACYCVWFIDLMLKGITLIISIIYSKCKNEDEKYFQEEKWIEILKMILDLIKII